MSTIAVSTGKPRPFAKLMFFLFVLIALIWVAVIYWWLAAQRTVTASDIVLFLIIAPCVAAACIVLLQWRVKRNDTSQDLTRGENTEAPSDRPEEQPVALLPILNAWAVTGGAPDADELVHALAATRLRPRPDPILTDDDGFPILSARVDNLDTTHVECWLAQADAHAAHVNTSEWPAAFIRSLALLGLLIEQMEPDCHLLEDAIARNSTIPDDSGITLRGAAAQSTLQAKPFRLLVKLMISAAFLPHERGRALDYLSHLLPLSQTPNLHLDIVPAQEDAAAIELLDRFRLESRAEDNPQALLLLACDSMLCPRVLEEWQARSRLFGTNCPNGLMAGEGSFGILCANDAALALLAALPACRLAGASTHMREYSADTPGKPCHAALDLAAQDAVALSGVTSERIGTVVCDTDHRTKRVLECIGTMARHTPHLDAMQNRLAISETCGHLGAASSLGTVATGVQRVLEAAHPVLLLNLGHPVERAAAVLAPAADA